MAAKKVTVSQLAKEAQVSPATVSRVMHHPDIVDPATARNVHAAMARLGYSYEVPARGVTRTPRGPIVMCIPWFDNPFYSEIIHGAQDAARMAGSEILVRYEAPASGSFERFIAALEACNASGVIMLCPTDAEFLVELDKQFPVVQCAEYTPAADLPFISIDDRMAAKKAVDCLVSCGCERLAIMRGPETYKYTRERYRGFVEALDEHGLQLRPEYTMQLPDNSYALAYSAASHLFGLDEIPDGIFTCSDVYAAAVIRASLKMGIKIPEELAVVGFDNIESSMMLTPSITTIAQPRYQMGYSACTLMLERLRGTSSDVSSMLLQTELISRESTTHMRR
ncbi:LacI family DNA-binding transcriptional regulator [Atopobium sp. oral taxon 810]|uniref:LacI family DNA-binding transcriptional regulator n=1 Tax=Atopobium sp. oral taxon 810 TaxID=712158 RepID=UPI000397CD17|nr:LacI family DNA-binding transcriptional regulator [Atopobium sp. oral taxon 810]ERI05354.1 sugar-binding domain protein [Atopobium sp. oral taxon 810 str. F0209]